VSVIRSSTKAPHALGFALQQAEEAGTRRRVGTVGAEHEHLHATGQRRERRAQFVGGVRQETALAGQQRGQPVDHVVERGGKVGQFVVAAYLRHPLVEIASGDGPAGCCHAAQRRQHRADERDAERDCGDSRQQRAGDEQQAQAGEQAIHEAQRRVELQYADDGDAAACRLHQRNQFHQLGAVRSLDPHVLPLARCDHLLVHRRQEGW